MDNAKQAIRWGIPGWLFFLFFLANHTFYLYVFHLLLKKENFGITTVFNSYDISFSTILVIVGILGIPIGFIIYQLYFVLSRTLPKDVSGSFLNNKNTKNIASGIYDSWNKEVERINEELKTVKSQGFITFSLRNLIHWVNRRILNIVFLRRSVTVTKRQNEIEELEIKWATVDVLFRKKILEKMDKIAYEEIIRRDSHLSDIFHSLGATNYSAFLAYIAYAINLTKNLFFNFYLYASDKSAFIIYFSLCYLIPLILTLFYSFIAWNNRTKCAIHKIAFMKGLME